MICINKFQGCSQKSLTNRFKKTHSDPQWLRNKFGQNINFDRKKSHALWFSRIMPSTFEYMYLRSWSITFIRTGTVGSVTAERYCPSTFLFLLFWSLNFVLKGLWLDSNFFRDWTPVALLDLPMFYYVYWQLLVQICSFLCWGLKSRAKIQPIFFHCPNVTVSHCEPCIHGGHGRHGRSGNNGVHSNVTVGTASGRVELVWSES